MGADRQYRERIYACYVNARQQALSPDSLAGLKPRLPMLQKLIRQHFPPHLNAAILDLGCCACTYTWLRKPAIRAATRSSARTCFAWLLNEDSYSGMS